jgi:predicted  nucleic acid-binding Zn-ribbon protein
MQETLQALQGLQQIDRHIFNVQTEQRRLPEELAVRTTKIDDQEAKLEEMRARVRAVRSEAKEIEDLTVGMRQRLRKLESESNKGKVDAALLMSYQHEMRKLKRNISQAEDEALKKLETGDAGDANIVTAESQLELAQTVFAEFEANVAKELKEANARFDELQAERNNLSADGIETDHLELYRRLLEIREGEALAELLDGHCQACFVQIPKNIGVRLARGTELVQCPSCDRIFYQY